MAGEAISDCLIDGYSDDEENNDGASSRQKERPQSVAPQAKRIRLDIPSETTGSQSSSSSFFSLVPSVESETYTIGENSNFNVSLSPLTSSSKFSLPEPSRRIFNTFKRSAVRADGKPGASSRASNQSAESSCAQNVDGKVAQKAEGVKAASTLPNLASAGDDQSDADSLPDESHEGCSLFTLAGSNKQEEEQTADLESDGKDRENDDDSQSLQFASESQEYHQMRYGGGRVSSSSSSPTAAAAAVAPSLWSARTATTDRSEYNVDESYQDLSAVESFAVPKGREVSVCCL